MYKNILFDLDGTLLPMDMEKFLKLYFDSVCKRCSPIVCVEPNSLIKALVTGSEAMIKNDNSTLNKTVFWESASESCQKDLTPYIKDFDDYYSSDFDAVKGALGFSTYAKKSVDLLKDRGVRLICATNPIFPKVATARRLKWAGVSYDDFDFVTLYDNMSCCKPNLKYYETICKVCNIKPEESLMVGNSVEEDMCAEELGFDTYLITDCLINDNNKDYSEYRQGSFEDFYKFLLEN